MLAVQVAHSFYSLMHWGGESVEKMLLVDEMKFWTLWQLGVAMREVTGGEAQWVVTSAEHLPHFTSGCRQLYTDHQLKNNKYTTTDRVFEGFFWEIWLSKSNNMHLPVKQYLMLKGFPVVLEKQEKAHFLMIWIIINEYTFCIIQHFSEFYHEIMKSANLAEVKCFKIH